MKDITISEDKKETIFCRIVNPRKLSTPEKHQTINWQTDPFKQKAAKAQKRFGKKPSSLPRMLFKKNQTPKSRQQESKDKLFD